MKIKIIIITILAIARLQLLAQSTKFEKISISVSGNCGMCKQRIQKASYLPGVQKAVWDLKSKQLEVVFKPLKTSKIDIMNNILNAGHDVEGLKAKDEDYQKLHNCCHYRDEN